MNNSTRCVVVFGSAMLCAAGSIAILSNHSSGRVAAAESLINADPETNYDFASADLHTLKFAQVEEVIRADAATRFPNSRVELGSLQSDHGGLGMTVTFFGSNRQAEAFLYRLVPHNNSWKIASTRRLWLVPRSQFARGLRV
jgi:hypothetical protein